MTLYEFLAIIGWVAMVFILLNITAVWGLVALNTLGKFNIGGVPNTLMPKIATLVFGAGLVLAWRFILSFITFNVSL